MQRTIILTECILKFHSVCGRSANSIAVVAVLGSYKIKAGFVLGLRCFDMFYWNCYLITTAVTRSSALPV